MVLKGVKGRKVQKKIFTQVVALPRLHMSEKNRRGGIYKNELKTDVSTTKKKT